MFLILFTNPKSHLVTNAMILQFTAVIRTYLRLAIITAIPRLAHTGVVYITIPVTVATIGAAVDGEDGRETLRDGGVGDVGLEHHGQDA